MESYFSYIDTALRVIYINRSSNQKEEVTNAFSKLFAQVETSKLLKQELLNEQFKLETDDNEDLENTIIHECHHYFQSLFYPFLYYINWLEFDNLMYLRSRILISSEQKMKLNDDQLMAQFETNENYTSSKYHLFWTDRQLSAKEPNEETPSKELFNLHDFLEDSTTLFQYKVFYPDGNHEHFYDWINNPSNKCYRRLYRFLEKKLGKQYVYDLLGLLVQVAFTTTEPIRAFCFAISFINEKLRDYRLYDRREIFDLVLEKLKISWGTVDINPLSHKYILDLPVGALMHENISKVIAIGKKFDGNLFYPLSLHADKFSALTKLNPELKYYLMDVNFEKFTTLMTDFKPFAIHFYLTNSTGRNSGLRLGSDFSNLTFENGVRFDGYIKELIKLKEITQGLLTKIQKTTPHNCNHYKCPYFELNLCKKWNSIPRKYSDCGFPYWFAHTFHRLININDLTLDKISSSEAQDLWDQYMQRPLKERDFNYLETLKGITLIIDKDNFGTDGMKDIMPAFIKFLTKEKQKSKASLSSALTLSFYGFKDDERPLFEIPCVKEWILTSITQIPELLCYIDFTADENNAFILLPALIKYKLVLLSHNKLYVEFDELDHQRFLQEQLLIFKDFLIENDGADEQRLLKNFNLFKYGNKNRG